MPERDEATTAADTLHRHGEPDPSLWDEAQAVTGRPQDKANPNTTFADRAKAAKKADAKQVEAPAENKAVAKKAAASKSSK